MLMTDKTINFIDAAKLEPLYQLKNLMTKNQPIFRDTWLIKTGQ